MEALSLEKMESLVGGSNYCDTAWILLSGGGFQGSDELYLLLASSYAANCPDHLPGSN
ncbi:hypothetical protein P872_05495 [Rhodonellum psychrophilum GCM71 = DSM 17998]|uniref:Uncharacterized protein n=2 Tax=Rhodonellum TaxID=336827 RepID=U5C1W6_9BACT|nr:MULTISPECIES: hypothetical protein [Rhodonellum]ERM82901.1 hypothetical protein P872_05495 [Rhodonellum psychrophilum GCM71 = DSM 17998]SDY47591.1 hypothetical protein SAMN05444412_101269 [Rhodonellum ikkaensis]